LGAVGFIIDIDADDGSVSLRGRIPFKGRLQKRSERDAFHCDDEDASSERI